jgi:hypothetical protein
MLRTTAHQQLRRTNPAKGYVAGSCNASMVAVTSDLGARSDEAGLLHPPLWDLFVQPRVTGGCCFGRHCSTMLCQLRSSA